MSSDQFVERWCKDHATPATVQWLVDHFEPAESSSIRRSILYNFYLEHCLTLKVEPLNPASFGKLIHSVFLGLKTRRLGTRGNSKYHYYGIRVKSTSALSKQILVDADFLLFNQTNNEFDYSNIDSQSNHFNMSLDEYAFSPLSTNQNESNFFYVTNDLSSSNNDLTPQITNDDITIFQQTHDDYSNRLFQAFLTFQEDLLQKLMQQFWSFSKTNSTQEIQLFSNDSTINWKFQRICTLPFIVDQLRSFYLKFYQTLIDQYFPELLTTIDATTAESIRSIGSHISGWMTNSTDHLDQSLKTVLHRCTNGFSSLLLRYTSLNHLCLTVQSMLQQSSRLVAMRNDLTEINFQDLHEQINWLIDCDLGLFVKIEQCFKNLFQCQTMLTVQNWIIFIESLLDDYLVNIENHKDYIYHARQFILKSNIYCSLILRELTLQNGTSMGSFHLLQLFIEEYLYHRLEQKISFSLNQSVLLTFLDNYEKRQQQQQQQDKYFKTNPYPDLFNDDDIDDDIESLSDDFIDHRLIHKPLSPVPIDEFMLPNETVNNSFSYIFEDLQPLGQELF